MGQRWAVEVTAHSRLLRNICMIEALHCVTVSLCMFKGLLHKWALICLPSIFSLISLSPSLGLSSFVLKFHPSSELSGRHCRCEEALVSVCSSGLSSQLFSLALCIVHCCLRKLVHQFHTTTGKSEGLLWKIIKLGFIKEVQCFFIKVLCCVFESSVCVLAGWNFLPFFLRIFLVKLIIFYCGGLILNRQPILPFQLPVDRMT